MTDARVPAPDERLPAPDERTHTLAVEMLSEVMGEIDRADQKASLLIGSLGIAFSIVLSSIIGGDWSLDSLSSAGVVVWIVGAAAASGSVFAAALAVWPRLSKGPGPSTITHWGQVRGLESPAAVADALAQRGLQPPERTYQQLLVLSAVVQRKYRCIRWSMAMAGIGIALVVAGFFLVS